MLKKRARVAACRAIAVLSFVVCSLIAGAAKHPPLPPKYAHWVKEEVPYLITDQEKEQFQSLASDAERDNFIASFWKERNPDPNSPVNTFQEEYYAKLVYANENFGTPGSKNGWRTDRGMVYITLGAPQQRRKYLNTRYLRSMEVWFYQSPSKALPAYFSLIFYQPSAAEDFRLYSPYSDRPEKLIASTNAVNDEPTALRIIQQDLGSEIERLTLSLIFGEPIDLKNGTPSLESDMLLSNIRNYRNLPENIDVLNQRRASLEGVTHRVILGEQFSSLATLVTRDSESEASVHYLFRFRSPQDFTLAKQADGRYYYALTVTAELSSAEGKSIYQDSQELNSTLTPQQVSEVQNKSFGVEGRLPIAPGKYQLRMTLTNQITKQTFVQTRALLVPAFDGPMGMSEVVFAENRLPSRDPSRSLPFSFSGVRVPILGADNAILAAGSPLRIIVQVWQKPDSPAWLQGKKLNVDYTIGQVGSADRQQQDQMIDRSSFDRQGNLLYGKDLATDALHSGSYRLVIRLTDPESQETTSQALNFEIETAEYHPLWTVVSLSFSSSPNAALNQYRMGLCELAQNQAVPAIRYLKEAVANGGSPDGHVYGALAAAYRMSGDEQAAAEVEKTMDRAADANSQKSKN
jgi:GWxTD domain-containing protein